MWDKIKLFFVTTGKSVNYFLTAHPKFKNILASLEKAVLASVVAYFGTIVNDMVNGVPIAQASNHCLLVGVAGGLFIAVSGAVRAWAQENHDMILAVVQDNVIASPQNVPVATSSVLTPLPEQPKTTS